MGAVGLESNRTQADRPSLISSSRCRFPASPTRISPFRSRLSMNHFYAGLFVLFLGALTMGCGSSEPAPVAEQDELTKWVSENPSPEAVPLSEGN